MKVEMKLSGMDGVLDMLKQLPPEIVSKRGGPVKYALRKGALVIFQQAKQNLQNVIRKTDDEGLRYSTGLLVKNLVVTRGKKPIGTKGERYLVRVRRKSYGRKDHATTLKTAQILEYGSEKQTPSPWIRPAFSATAEKSIRTVETELVKKINAIVKKLSKAPK